MPIQLKRILFSSALVTACLFCSAVVGQESKSEAAAEKESPKQEDSKNKVDEKKKALFKKFAEEMSGVKLVGTFTIDGRGGKLREEEYTIDKVEKAGDGDLWTFTARIKYGNIDVPVPLTIPVKWAGDTPMVSISNFRIPLVGSGTFGARVVFDDGKYAGTWNHDKVGGHMFGRIEKIKKEDESEE